ncbi:hypothetical protein COL27_29820, partial [Bacillus sp. AFS075960]
MSLPHRSVRVRPMLAGLCSVAALYGAPADAQEFSLFAGSL